MFTFRKIVSEHTVSNDTKPNNGIPNTSDISQHDTKQIQTPANADHLTRSTALRGSADYQQQR